MKTVDWNDMKKLLKSLDFRVRLFWAKIFNYKNF